MARELWTYRAAKRNLARSARARFPLNIAQARRVALPPIRQNKRDRSPEAEAARRKRKLLDVTIDFCCERGLSRMQVNYNPNAKTVSVKKPKRGWAAERRAAPFKDYFDAEKMAAIRARHVHPRHMRVYA